MSRIARIVAATGLFACLAAAGSARADEADAIIDKAIRAHGIKANDAKGFAYRGKNKGTLHLAAMDLDFTQQMVVKLPASFKEVMDLTVMNQKVTVTTVFNGKEGWIKVNDKDLKVEKELLEELQEAAHMMQLSQSLMFKDKSLKLSLIGEAMVNDKPAIGVRVAKEGKKDLNFYFDKATGLTAKTERRARDLQTGQEMTEERIITEYQDLKGRKIAKKVQMKRDGKDFLEVEVVEASLLDSVDDSEFAKP